MVDARLPDGSRVNAIIKPLAIDGPHLSIRKFKRDALSGEDLLRLESLNEPMLDLLQGHREGAAQRADSRAAPAPARPRSSISSRASFRTMSAS
jgi:hypothetical protein